MNRFSDVLHESVRHMSLALPFELFRFWLRIYGEIEIENRLPDDKIAYSYPFFKPLNKSMVIIHYIPCLFLPNWSFKGTQD
jgi:hypothetical protein